MKKEKFTNKIIQKLGIPIVFATALYWIHSQNCVTPGTNPLLMAFTIFGGLGIVTTILRSLGKGKNSPIMSVLMNGMLLMPAYLLLTVANKIPFVNFTNQNILMIALVIVVAASIKAYMEVK